MLVAPWPLGRRHGGQAFHYCEGMSWAELILILIVLFASISVIGALRRIRDANERTVSVSLRSSRARKTIRVGPAEDPAYGHPGRPSPAANSRIALWVGAVLLNSNYGVPLCRFALGSVPLVFRGRIWLGSRPVFGVRTELRSASRRG